MKPLLSSYLIIILTTLILTISARRLLPHNFQIPSTIERKPNSNNISPRSLSHYLSPNQKPILPSGTMGNTNTKPTTRNQSLYITDILSKTREIAIFSSLTRDIESVSARFNNEAQNSTVLAPLNSAIQDLPRKPWEDPDDYERFGETEAYAGKEGEGRAAKNLRRFVEAHIVPEAPWKQAGEEGALQTVGGGRVWWKKERGKVYIYPGKIEVQKIDKKASNGEVWVLKGVINYA
ncbi:hypothetical protein AJ79_04086 [Helicocarpus griseus UAMH5409]|uniref:FAS1 domain-containing protein n=1 Tax=Helicocarpus griseus UAMH5409 TaxID=1447875 RepID=A0A2B7XUV0_9EURO|nr:hypothetical protein AJ79_04086 [Helicocarpus griseus UAMH5409]